MDGLAEIRLLKSEDLQSFNPNADVVDYDAVREHRNQYLKKLLKILERLKIQNLTQHIKIL